MQGLLLVAPLPLESCVLKQTNGSLPKYYRTQGVLNGSLSPIQETVYVVRPNKCNRTIPHSDPLGALALTRIYLQNVVQLIFRVLSMLHNVAVIIIITILVFYHYFILSMSHSAFAYAVLKTILTLLTYLLKQ